MVCALKADCESFAACFCLRPQSAAADSKAGGAQTGLPTLPILVCRQRRDETPSRLQFSASPNSFIVPKQPTNLFPATPPSAHYLQETQVPGHPDHSCSTLWLPDHQCQLLQVFVSFQVSFDVAARVPPHHRCFCSSAPGSRPPPFPPPTAQTQIHRCRRTIAAMAERYIPEHRRTQFKAKSTFKPEELRRRREEAQVEIRKAKREENLAKRRGIGTGENRPGASLGAAPDSDDENPPSESQVRIPFFFFPSLVQTCIICLSSLHPTPWSSSFWAPPPHLYPAVCFGHPHSARPQRSGPAYLAPHHSPDFPLCTTLRPLAGH